MTEQELIEKIALLQIQEGDLEYIARANSSPAYYLAYRIISQILTLIKQAGYRLRKGKAPLLTDEQRLSAFDSDFGEVAFDHKSTAENILLIKLRLVAQAQLDSANRHFGGKE